MNNYNYLFQSFINSKFKISINVYYYYYYLSITWLIYRYNKYKNNKYKKNKYKKNNLLIMENVN